MNSADIIFNATVDGAGVDLDLTSGATGDIFFNAAVGQTDPITVTIMKPAMSTSLQHLRLQPSLRQKPVKAPSTWMLC